MTLKKSAVVAIVATFVPIVCLASAFTPRFEKIYLDQDAKAAPPAQSSARSNPSAPNAATPSSDASETGAKPAPAPHVIVVMPDSPPRITSDGVTSPHAIVVAPYAAVPAPRAYVYAVPPQQPGAPSVPVTVYAPPSVRLDAPVAIHVEPMPPMPPVSVDVKAMMKVNVEPFQEGSTTIIRTDDHADSYVIVSGKMSYSVIAGPENISIINDGDNSAAQELRGRYGDHFIWFRLNGKEYVITDPATVQKAMQSFDKMNELGKQQEELGRQQEVLGDQQSKLGELQSQQFANLPDVSKEMDQLNAELKQLNSPETKEAIAKAQANLDAAIAQLNANSPNMEETLAKLQAESEAMSQKISAESLAQIQEQLGEIQGKIGEAEALSGESAGKLGALQGQLGAKQGELGRKQGELGREQERASRDAQRQLRKLFQDAVANGTAKPQ